MKALLLSFLLIVGVNVLMVATDNWNFDGDIFMWILPVGMLVLGSKVPRVLGVFLIFISPTTGFGIKGGEESLLPVYIAGGFFVCWGLYNIIMLGKSSYTYRQVLLRNIAIPLVAVAIFLVNVKLL